MKNSFRILLLLATLSVIINNVHAAENSYDPTQVDESTYDPDLANSYYKYNFVSPHVADMFRYGEFGTSLFTGRMQQTIPIYTLDDPDFKMNIALHYNAEGFKSRKHSGLVGYNWFLEAGGCITREVQGYPDEVYGIINTFAGNLDYEMGIEGMYHFIANKRLGWDKSKEEIFELPHSPANCKWDMGKYSDSLYRSVGDVCDHYYIDYQPDIFHFNFMGYKGTFIIDNNGKVQIVNGDFVSVDLSGILDDDWSRKCFGSIPPYPKKNSTIIIKTTDGYTYYFGEDLSKLEYTLGAYNNKLFLPRSPELEIRKVNPATVSTWYLSRIISPNGRIVSFHYKGSSFAPAQESNLWEFNEYYDRFLPYFWAQIKAHDGLICKSERWNIKNDEYIKLRSVADALTPPYIPLYAYLYSQTKTCVLDSISVSGEQPLSIIFDNSLDPIKMYNNDGRYGEYPYYNNKHDYQLNSVRVVSCGKTIKTATLSYNYESCIGAKGVAGNLANIDYSLNWRFLDSIHISGVGKYQMEYYKGTYPDLCRYAAFYNPLVDTCNECFEGYVLRKEMDDYGYYLNGDFRMGLLKQVTYPTGGFQRYAYGPYQFDKKRKYVSIDDRYVEMRTFNETGTLKGARIIGVNTHDKNGYLIETKSYTYEDGIFYDNLRVHNLTLKNAYVEPKYATFFDDNGALKKEVDELCDDGLPVILSSLKNLFYTYPKYIVKHLLEALHIIPRGEAYDVTKDPLLKDGWPIYSIANYSMFDSHIGYGKVTERVNISQGEAYTTVYFFDTGEDTYFPEKDKNINTRYEYEEYDGGLSKVLSGEMFYNSKLHKWGKLMSIEYYNSNGTFTKSVHYEYNSVTRANSSAQICSDTIVTFVRNASSDISKRLLVYPDYMTKKITRYCDQGGGSTTITTEAYSYDNKLRVKEEKITDSRDSEHFTRYTYPDKMYGNTRYSLFDTLSQKGIIGRPVETITGYTQNGTEYITGGKIDIWAFNLVTENGKKVKRPYLSKTFSLALTEPLYLSKYQRLSAGQNKKPIYDSHYVLDAEYKYDEMNRLTSIKPFGQMETKYSWNGIYPDTKTIGDQVWKYSFIPYVGVQSITDPRGITTYYTYDEAGRLVEEYRRERDGYKQILNAYQYHIKTE